jgi:hypothetical protein
MALKKFTKKELYELENQSYSKSPSSKVDGFELFPKYTDGIKIYIRGNDIVVAIRGTADSRDLLADVRIANGSLYKSSRYLADKSFMDYIQRIYPKTQYNYYGVGHSLGGAILDQLIADGYIQSGISYNPAVEYKYRNSTANHRIYNEDDLLYKLMGRFTKNPEIRKNDIGIVSKVIKKIPLGNIGVGIKAHLLSNFVGGRIIHKLILK